METLPGTNALQHCIPFLLKCNTRDTQRISQWQEILSIKVKRQEKRSVNYLSIDGIKSLLEQIPTNSRIGRRNLALISLLYDSGARVQEIIDLVPVSLHLNKPYCITLFGKGSKKRVVPLQDEQVKLLMTYMEENNLLQAAYNQQPLFANNRGGKLTNAGVTYIINAYANNARTLKPELIPDKISPHTFRHSKAMHLLQAGVNLVYISYPNSHKILTFNPNSLIISAIKIG